jgi:hypothetical protein
MNEPNPPRQAWTLVKAHAVIARAVFVSLFLVFVAASAHAQGGPPLITDDPDTPGPGYWEINIPMILESSHEGRHFDAPLADVNYGLGQRIQLKFEIPWVTMLPRDGSAQTGIGNNNAGVKWRFLGSESERLGWSIYPQLETNTRESSAAKGLVERDARFFLPTELTVRKGRIEINGEVGWMFVRGGKDGWAAGVTTEIEVGRRFELLGELHAEKDAELSIDEIVNVGGRIALTEKIWLLAAVGTGVNGGAEERVHLRIYAGIQLNFPKQSHGATLDR